MSLFTFKERSVTGCACPTCRQPTRVDKVAIGRTDLHPTSEITALPRDELRQLVLDAAAWLGLEVRSKWSRP